jgi:ATP-binding cassette subfamily G (WHITE) protein 2 (SNQ2)
MFEDLRVAVQGASATYQPTLGSRFNILSALGNVSAARHPPTRDILSGFEGCVRPGEMLRTCTAVS